MEGWRQYLQENEEVAALIDDNVLLIENQQVVGEKNFDVLCEEARQGALTEERFFDILNEAAEHEWSLIEEELSLEEGVDLQAVKKWGKEKWAKLKSAAVVKGFKFVINAINRIIKILASMLDTFGMKLYLGAMQLIAKAALGARKLAPYIGPGLWVLGAILIFVAAYSGTLEVLVDQAGEAIQALGKGEIDASQVQAAMICEFQCNGEVIEKNILASAVDLLTSDLYSNLGGEAGIEEEMMMTYQEQATENNDVVKLVDYKLIDQKYNEANVTVDAIRGLSDDLHDLTSRDGEKFHWKLDNFHPKVAEKIEAAIEMATEMRELDPEMADASAEAGQKVKTLWSGHVQATFETWSKQHTKVVGGEKVIDDFSQSVKDFTLTKGKYVPSRGT
tara:strand:- start:91 stop:1263 length:1173 start_codon:yes stop_codon:yes gene_type:complete